MAGTTDVVTQLARGLYGHVPQDVTAALSGLAQLGLVELAALNGTITPAHMKNMTKLTATWVINTVQSWPAHLGEPDMCYLTDVAAYSAAGVVVADPSPAFAYRHWLTRCVAANPSGASVFFDTVGTTAEVGLLVTAKPTAPILELVCANINRFDSEQVDSIVASAVKHGYARVFINTPTSAFTNESLTALLTCWFADVDTRPAVAQRLANEHLPLDVTIGTINALFADRERHQVPFTATSELAAHLIVVPGEVLPGETLVRLAQLCLPVNDHDTLAMLVTHPCVTVAPSLAAQLTEEVFSELAAGSRLSPKMCDVIAAMILTDGPCRVSGRLLPDAFSAALLHTDHILLTACVQRCITDSAGCPVPPAELVVDAARAVGSWRGELPADLAVALLRAAPLDGLTPNIVDLSARTENTTVLRAYLAGEFNLNQPNAGHLSAFREVLCVRHILDSDLCTPDIATALLGANPGDWFEVGAGLVTLALSKVAFGDNVPDLFAQTMSMSEAPTVFANWFTGVFELNPPTTELNAAVVTSCALVTGQQVCWAQLLFLGLYHHQLNSRTRELLFSVPGVPAVWASTMAASDPHVADPAEVITSKFIAEVPPAAWSLLVMLAPGFPASVLGLVHTVRSAI